MPHIGDTQEQVVRDALEHRHALDYRERTIGEYLRISHLIRSFCFRSAVFRAGPRVGDWRQVSAS